MRLRSHYDNNLIGYSSYNASANPLDYTKDKYTIKTLLANVSSVYIT